MKGIKLSWMNKIRGLEEKQFNCTQVLRELKKYGLCEEKRITEGFKNDA